jgi:UDP-N-acetylmuramate dehydrogenase
VSAAVRTRALVGDVADVDAARWDGLAARLAVALGDGRVERGASLAAFTTYRLGGPAAVLVRVGRLADVAAVAAVLDADAPLLVVGRGSNLLVADTGFPGVALVLDGDHERLDLPAAGPAATVTATETVTETAAVTAGAAVALPVLARRTAAAGWAGLEFYVGIPGTVGGAVRMNAGGHGTDTAAVLVSAVACDLAADGAPETWTRDDLDLGYRRSALGERHVVVSATFAVRADDPAAAGERVDEIVRWRRQHQPGGQNAGSVFTNPPGDSAGRLVEAAGLKGHRRGGAHVSTKHANFIQADEGATARDVADLVADVQRRVAAATGVHLVPEIHFVGFPVREGDAP